MLKNCFLPVSYNKTSSQTCGEIICENLNEFIINCQLCKIKIFEYEEFILHFKNVHLSENLSEDKPLQNEKKDERNNLVEIKCESYHSSEENDDIPWNVANNESSDEYKCVDEKNTDDEEEQDVEETQSKSIIRKSGKPKDLTCEICGKKYADSRRLRLHVKIVHLQEKPYKCSICQQAFAGERSLKNHISHKHTGHECPECHKSFKANNNLKRHMLVHLDKKEFVCTEDNCGKAFATKMRLKVHQRYHAAAMFVCEECGYECWKRDSLTVHKRNHAGVKPFGCKLCDRRFASKPLLTEHMAAHESERKHVCDVCGKSFNRPKALYHHKHLHLGVKKFVCKICGHAYAQAAGLSTHMRKHKENGNAFITDNPLTSNSSNTWTVLNTF